MPKRPRMAAFAGTFLLVATSFGVAGTGCAHEARGPAKGRVPPETETEADEPDVTEDARKARAHREDCTNDLPRSAHCASFCPRGRTCVREVTCLERTYCFRILAR